MRFPRKPILILPVLACLVACEATTPPIKTRIISEPPGAKIEVNGSYLGEAPVEVTLRQTSNHKKLKDWVLIRALPSIPGQQVQEKRFQQHQVAPAAVYFDMTLQSQNAGVLNKPVEPAVPPTPNEVSPSPGPDKTDSQPVIPAPPNEPGPSPGQTKPDNQ